MNERDFQVLSALVPILHRMSRERTQGETIADVGMVQAQLHHLLMVLDTEERDLKLAQERLTRELELVSNLRGHLYNEQQVLAALRRAG